MIRHTVLFKWAADATDEQKKAAATEVAKLPSIVPSVRAFASGADARFADKNFDFAVTADFDDEAGYFAYRDDPRHRELVQRYVTPIVAQRAAVQFEF
jgi:Stress responsive A/B Barrel Domain